MKTHVFAIPPLMPWVGSVPNNIKGDRPNICVTLGLSRFAGFNAFSQRNEARIIRSRPLTLAPQYIEPWPTGQDPFESFEHTHGVQPAQNLLPQDRRVPQDFVPAAPRLVLPPTVPPQNTLPHDDLSITRRRQGRLTVRPVSRHTPITTSGRRHQTRVSLSR